MEIGHTHNRRYCEAGCKARKGAVYWGHQDLIHFDFEDLENSVVVALPDHDPLMDPLMPQGRSHYKRHFGV